MIKHYVESYNAIVLAHLEGEYNTLLEEKEIQFLTQILLDLQIKDDYDSNINKHLAETNQMQAGLLVIVSKARSAYEKLEARRVLVKSEVLANSKEILNGRGIKSPTKDQYEQYAHTMPHYQVAYEAASSMKAFNKFIEETREVLGSREKLLHEISTNIRFRNK